MFTGLSYDMIMFVSLLVLAGAFFVGNGIDAIMGAQGFGVYGNMVILTCGFVIGVRVVEDSQFIDVSRIMTVPAAIGFAFLCHFLLAVVKLLTFRT